MGLSDVASPVTAAEATSESPTELYVRLIRGADVLVEDFSPSSDRQALVRFDWLAGLNPRLVQCSITAYGKHGPYRDEPPIDALVMARAGILASQPGFRPGPVHIVHPLPSAGAALLAAQGIAAALLAREKTGLGRTVETSLLAGALLYHPKVTGEKLAPHVFQTNPAGSAPFYSLYECADGIWMQLGCVHEAFIATAAAVMGIKDVLDAPRYGSGRLPKTPEADQELRAIIARAIHSKPYEEWAELFEKADVPFAKVRTTEESMDDPQVRVNEMVVELHDPELVLSCRWGCLSSSRARPAKSGSRGCFPARRSVDRLLRRVTPSRRPKSVGRRRQGRSSRRFKAFACWKSPTSSPARRRDACWPSSAPT